jgi:hypothetical protein
MTDVTVKLDDLERIIFAASEALREKAKELCRDLEGTNLVITALQAAHFDAYRDEFKAAVEATGTWAELEVAKQIMRGEGFAEDMLDLICGAPGFKAPVATMADGKEAVCIEYMAGLTPKPLSAYFLDRVRGAIEISARVGALEMLRAEGKGDAGAQPTREEPMAMGGATPPPPQPQDQTSDGDVPVAAGDAAG